MSDAEPAVDPLVDVVIPLHAADRDIEAAVASAQSDVQGVATRVTVVLHDLDLDPVRIDSLRRRARVVRCRDGTQSPSGPRNVGLEQATAPWVSFLDSDDLVAPGCLRTLLTTATAVGVDVALPAIRTAEGFLGTPSTRRVGVRLDPVADGLFYRSHAFGLLRRSALADARLRFPEGIRTGQDLVMMSEVHTRLRVAYEPCARYDLRTADLQRVTTTPMPVRDQLAAVQALVAAAWVQRLPDEVRTALVVRLLSVNLADAWRRRQRLGHPMDAGAYAEQRDALLTLAPTATRYLSVRDRAGLRFDVAASGARGVLQARPLALVPTSLRGAVDPAGPIAQGLARASVRRRAARLHPS